MHFPSLKDIKSGQIGSKCLKISRVVYMSLTRVRIPLVLLIFLKEYNFQKQRLQPSVPVLLSLLAEHGHINTSQQRKWPPQEEK